MANTTTWTSWKPEQYADRMPSAPDSYHNAIWQKQAAVYEEMWKYYNRDIFKETLHDRTDDRKYPLGINLFEQACVNHRAALLGEFEDDVLAFRVKNNNSDKIEVENKLDQIWAESGRNSILLEGGLIAQILGGVVYRAWHNPYRKKVYVRMVVPDAFFPVWDPDDYHTILECFLVYQIDRRTALLRYNVRPKRYNDSDDESPLIVHEHWTQDFYEVTVDGQVATWDRGRHFPMAGPNPYNDPDSTQGIIPFEYFPRDRAGNFYGIPLGKNALELQNEYNLRGADMGDAILEATHKYKFIKNRPNGLRGLEHLDRVGLNNLGMSAPGKEQIDVDTVDGGQIPPGATEWLSHLREEGRTSMFSPPVSYGQDEGSQRSALTLAFRMWPLTQAVRTCRGFWTDSFASFNKKLIIVASSFKYGYNLEARHASYRTVPVWSPMLPRDREGLVNEVVQRKANGVISVRRSIELLEEKETEWVEKEIAEIKKDANEEAQRQVKINQAGMMARQQQQQQSGGSTNTAPSS